MHNGRGQTQATRVTYQSSTPKLKTSAACSRGRGVGRPVIIWERSTLIAKAHHAIIKSSAARLHLLCYVSRQLLALLGAGCMFCLLHFRAAEGLSHSSTITC